MSPLKFLLWMNIAALWFGSAGWLGYVVAKQIGLWKWLFR